MTTISTPAAARAAATATRSRTRFGILALISVGTMINYLDRTVLGIAAPTLRVDLGIDAAVMGLVFSAFAWTYAASQIPGGVFLDRFGSKLTAEAPQTMDAPAVARMREHGAVILGKTTMPEYGWKAVSDSQSAALVAEKSMAGAALRRAWEDVMSGVLSGVRVPYHCNGSNVGSDCDSGATVLDFHQDSNVRWLPAEHSPSNY